MTRQFKRPPFLAECFEELEPQRFYMFSDCQCCTRKNNKIKFAFYSKQKSTVEALKGIANFFE